MSFVASLNTSATGYGSQLTLIDQWYPSSQICSNCGHKQKMPLNQRIYDCPNCEISIDRDLNAAINLEVRP